VEPATFNEMVAPPAGGRVFTQTMRPGLADCAPSGRIRLDALARWLQEIAYADVEDAGLADSAVWVVRRTRLLVSRFPRFAERWTLSTFCSGLGRMWAERRTTITCDGAEAAEVEAVSLWVHLDPASWRPAPFDDAEIAAYWLPLEEELLLRGVEHPEPEQLDVAYADVEDAGLADSAVWVVRRTRRRGRGRSAQASATSPITSITRPTGCRSRRSCFFAASSTRSPNSSTSRSSSATPPNPARS
jgi:acyl-CoA thioesterase FadM